MLYGITPVQAALRAGKRSLRRLLVKEGRPSPRLREAIDLARGRGLPVEARTVHEIGRLARTRQHQGVLLECDELPPLGLEEFLGGLPEGPASILALDQVEDPQNLGGLIRTAAFLGADAVMTLRSRSAPLSPAASKASAGTMEFFPVVRVANLSEALQRLRREFWTVIGSDLGSDSVDYREVEPPERAVLVVGAEGSGIRPLTRKRCDHVVRIPGNPDVESLNVTVSAGVMLARLLQR